MISRKQGGFALQIARSVSIFVPDRVAQRRSDGVSPSEEKILVFGDTHVPNATLIASSDGGRLKAIAVVTDQVDLRIPLIVDSVPVADADTVRDLLCRVARENVESFTGGKNWAD